MTEQSKENRPSQVTMAGWVAAVASALTVMMLFESVGRLQTVEFRDNMEELLATPPYDGLGLEIAQVVELFRGAMLIAGAAAAAALVLAIYVLKRHNAARIGFTVAAVVLVLTAPFTGGFLPILIAIAATWLWSRPARDWFAGRPVTQTQAQGNDRRGSSAAAHPHPSRVEGNTVSSENHPPRDESEKTPEWPRMPEDSSDRPQPPPRPGYGSPSSQPGQGAADQAGQGRPQGQPGHGGQYPPPYPQPAPQDRPGGQPSYPPPPYGQGGYGQQPPYGQPAYGQQPAYGYPPYGAPSYGGRPADRDKRPTTVTVAAWITWVFSALALLSFLGIGVAMTVAPDEFMDQIRQDPSFEGLGVTDDQIVAGMWVVVVALVVWSVSAMVFAWFAFRRANWARIMLVVSASVSLVFSLLAFPVGIPHVLATGAVITLLFVGGANAWFKRSLGAQGYPGPFQPYGQPGQPGQYGQPGQQGQQGQQGQPGQYGLPPQQSGPQGAEPGRPGGSEAPEEPGRNRDADRDRRRDEPPPNVW